MLNKKIILLGVGDNLLVMKDPEAIFALADPVLRSGYVVVGQLETLCTARPAYYPTIGGGMGVKPPHACEPKRLDALRSAGFNVIHLARNKIIAKGII